MRSMSAEQHGNDSGPSRIGDPPGGMPPVPALPEAEEPRFIADVNVGKLAKWLRILGHDTLFLNPIEDEVLVQIGLREERIVLTKDTHIAEPVSYTHLRAHETRHDLVCRLLLE